MIAPHTRHALISGIIVEVIVLLVDSAVNVSDALIRFLYKAVIDELLKVFLPRTPTPVEVPFIINADCDQGLAINDLNALFFLFNEVLNAEVGL